MSKADEQVKALFDIVQKKKAEVAKAEKPSWETNCVFHPDPNSSQSLNIQALTKAKDLVGILAFLLEKQSAFDEANKQLGTNVKFDWGGFTVEQWRSDLKTRIDKIDITTKRKELEALEVRLNALVSPEMRHQMELDEIAALLGSKS